MCSELIEFQWKWSWVQVPASASLLDSRGCCGRVCGVCDEGEDVGKEKKAVWGSCVSCFVSFLPQSVGNRCRLDCTVESN